LRCDLGSVDIYSLLQVLNNHSLLQIAISFISYQLPLALASGLSSDNKEEALAISK
jgi:hypothetical protein